MSMRYFTHPHAVDGLAPALHRTAVAKMRQAARP
jgi:hypothetical protein